MSQTNTIESINSLLVQLPEPLQIEALHYVEYLTSCQVVVVDRTRDRPATSKRNGFGILKGKVTISDDFDAPWKNLPITSNLCTCSWILIFLIWYIAENPSLNPAMTEYLVRRVISIRGRFFFRQPIVVLAST